MRVLKITTFLILGTGISLGALAQTIIHLVDKKSGDPVPFAQVCFESLNRETVLNRIADENGTVKLDLAPPFQLTVSSMGYVTTSDTIRTGGERTILLAPSMFELGEVVLTGQYSPKRVDQSIYNVKVIDNRKIREKGANNLNELLSTELGIRINNSTALGSNLSIQGLSGEHVKILVDGVPVIGRLNGNLDLDQINMYNVDHIEMVEGPMSVL